MNIGLTLFAQSLVFILFVAFCMKYIWPLLKAAMEERRQSIAQGLAAAEEAERKLGEAHSGAEEALAKARADAAQIIEQARQRANRMVEEAKNEARAEGERLLESAKAEIDQEVNRAKEDLRRQVAALALLGAEKVLEERIDQHRHDRLLDSLAAEL